jgi:glycosyltransferase involved in cell wall biosynthesis
LPFLEQNGYRFTFSYLLNEEQDKIYYKPGNYFKKLKIAIAASSKRIYETIVSKKYDLIFVHREAYMLGTSFFERVMANKVPMIFDFDDSIWIENVISEGNKKLAFLKNASKTSDIIKESALVFAGNDYLATYARKFNKEVVVVPTTIDTEKYQCKTKKKKDGALCIGWSGSFSTIEHFKTSITALQKIKEKYGTKVHFMIIGDENYYCKELQTQGLPWRPETEVDDLCKIDIGIMPLPDTDWARGKCGLKALQYMGLSIPTLMSPVGVNTDIVQNAENGFLSVTEDEWILHLSTLVEEDELRQKIGAAGRQTVIDRYSVIRWKSKYLDYFNQLTTMF